jgi:hypothetical protein
VVSVISTHYVAPPPHWFSASEKYQQELPHYPVYNCRSGSGVSRRKTAQSYSGMHFRCNDCIRNHSIDEPFSDTNEEGFEVGAFWMWWASTRRALCLPMGNNGPIEKGKEGSIGGNDGIMGEQMGHGRLVKKVRNRYHNRKLLC